MKLLKLKKRIGIGVRLAIMVAVLIVLSTGSFAFFSLMKQRSEAMELFVHNSINMCRSLERILRFSMLENRRDEIQAAIQQIAKEDDIDGVTLVSHRGDIVYGDALQDPEKVTIGDNRCSGCHGNGSEQPLPRLAEPAEVRLLHDAKVAEVSLPIYNDPACANAACHAHTPAESVLGIMQMNISYAQTNEMLNRSYFQLMALSIVIALVTSLIVMALIRRWVSNPVKDLLDGTRRVAEGEIGHIIPVGEAELGGLARAFNKMQEKLLSSQRQLVTAEKLASIGKLAASVAHEINNPLTGILTFAEDLAENADHSDPRRSDFEVIRRQAVRCREIVRQLLDFSRQEKPNLRPVNVNEVLVHTIEFISKQAIFRNIVITTDLENDLPPVIADPIQIEQVMLDLLVNAAEAMSDGGNIFISSLSHQRSHEVEVVVRDTGPGIAEENLPRIFEPFFSTKGGKSMGIGLAVSWNIINQHGGRLEVESKLGEGVTFHIMMPWGKAAPASADAVV
ncbi:MAG: HAMP domain-containing protein [Candidatus Abyssobacteria bacterium SURF_5]|uniref:histidine kinase n=1 Tax=Abyssobacteria bacterium (strain SURF_5) TaxID=2093360 RepID=A0A3A4NWI1_ABYX5|nr:MAG: HAMP domain-containing protein [Candidatus Abyssubacteria bacterium SURF_5]